MHTVASRELRNQTRSLLDRVANGEEIAITIDGRPVALLTPVRQRRRWMSRESFLHRISTNQADAGLRGDLTQLAPDTTDDLPW